ncbi:PAS domain S-box protein [Aliterella atlantica]|uniref:Circadian input-output histidine kinase CikA n=1 Tax=Aliterella atlantica CENA595 TaxID=1618023 RepID=A0A0D8ZUX6_9CYAN|nr:PAS domain S-box protein [Aliterella atlantica]KJH72545.1 histidine kinase [Aliterella atlantica CENA595]
MEENVKILVVDDDEVDRMLVKRSLKAAGVKTQLEEATNCTEALAIVQQQSFDCIFLDYLLPDGDGLSLVQQIRSLGIATPLVVLTGQGDERIAVEVMKAGAADYIAKSRLSPESLYQTLRQAVRLYRAEQAAILANERLRQSEERYRLVLEGANDGIWDWYCSTDEVYSNDRLLEIIGATRENFQLTASNLMALMHPDDLPKIRLAIKNHLQYGEKCEAEFRIRHTDGEYRYCVARGKAQRDRYNCPVRMSGIISDISEQKQLEEALRASQSRFRRLAEANIIGIIVADAEGKLIEANDAFLAMTGYSREDIHLGRLHWQEITPPEYAQSDRRAAEELLSKGVFGAYEKECICSDGSRIPLLLGGALVEGTETFAICFAIDLRDRKRTDAQIGELNRDLERRVSEMQTLLDVIPIGIAIAQDPQCQHIQVNPSLAKLLGLSGNANASKSAPVGDRPDYEVYKEGRELDAVELPMQQAAAQGIEVLNSEIDLLVDTTQKLKLLANAAPLFDEQGKSRGSVGVFWDITERKRIEEQERFLAEASAILAASLDYRTTLTNLAFSIVSRQADWCSIHVVDEEGALRLVAVAHANPLQMQWAQQLQQTYPLDPQAKIGAPQVIRTGQAELYSEITDSTLRSLATSEESWQILQQLKLKSMMCVPLKARGRALGAITFVTNELGRSYNSNDLKWAEDLARRAGLALDNARLYQQATDIGENLRRAIIILGEQQQQLRVLQRITNLLNQRLTNLPSLLQVMVGSVCDGISEAEFAAIAMVQSNSKSLELTATSGIDQENLQFLPYQARLIHQVFLTGKAQLVKQKQPQIDANNPLTAPAAIYAVAIESATAGRLGVLLIGNWQDPEAFDVEDRNLLEAVGEQAAIAINNARLINALEEREERLGIQNEILASQNRELEITRSQIERQNLQLIEAARLKSQFLATMSHELRTPMNAVIGFAQVLLRQRTATLNPTQVDMVERILNNGKNLLALINDILDLSKIEAGRLKLRLEEFDLVKLISATLAELRPLAEQKQLPLRFQVQLADPMVVNDSTRVRQILVNLLSNAIKFTDTGTVDVTIGQTPDRVIISVKDTGVGIAESELEHIFEEFRQVDQTTTRQHGGTGLGLAITRSLVNMMQGAIAVESQLEQGSTFTVSLPRQVVTTQN